MTVPQYLEKLVSIDGATSYTFGLKQQQVTRSQNLRTPLAVGIGADYAHDFLGYGRAPRDAETLSMSWLNVQATAALVDTEIDSCRSKLLSIGKGKLYALFADASERWCYARATAMPSFSRAPGQLTYVPMTAAFTRLSNWYATAAATGTQSVTTQGTQSFTITNAGNVYVRDAVFRLRANVFQGFYTPAIVNSTTGEWIYDSRIAETADSEIKIDGSAQSVYWSPNDGGTYADDYSRISRGATQIGLFSLAPGANTIVSCGGDLWPMFCLMNPRPQNYSFEWSYNTPYA